MGSGGGFWLAPAAAAGINPPAGQIGGTAAVPTVVGLTETGGPSALTLGAIATLQILQRQGANLVGIPRIQSAHGARVYNNAVQSIPNNANTVLTFNSEDDDTDNYHDNAVNNSRITVPAGLAGVYAVIGGVVWASIAALGLRASRPLVNGAAINGIDAVEIGVSGQIAGLAWGHLIRLAVGDYLEHVVYQSSGSALNAGAAAAPDVNVLAAYLVGV